MITIQQNLFLDDIFCKDCKNQDSMRYDYREGNVVCISCGFIAVRRFIDFTAEYNIFADNTDGIDPRRAGGVINENLEDGGLGTYLEILGERKSYRNNFYGGNQKHSEGVRKLKTWGDMLGLEQKVMNMVIDNFEKLIMKKNIIKNTDELLAAILFMTCRSEKSFLNIGDLEKISGKSKRNIKKCFWLIKRNFNRNSTNKETTMKPSYFAKIFADKLNLPYFLIEKIKKIGEKFESVGLLEGKNPKNVASVIIYNESNCIEETRKSFKEIAEISEISDSTIKKTYDHLLKKLGALEIQITQKESFEKVLEDLEKLEL